MACRLQLVAQWTKTSDLNACFFSCLPSGVLCCGSDWHWYLFQGLVKKITTYLSLRLRYYDGMMARRVLLVTQWPLDFYCEIVFLQMKRMKHIEYVKNTTTKHRSLSFWEDLALEKTNISLLKAVWYTSFCLFCCGLSTSNNVWFPFRFYSKWF